MLEFDHENHDNQLFPCVGSLLNFLFLKMSNLLIKSYYKILERFHRFFFFFPISFFFWTEGTVQYEGPGVELAFPPLDQSDPLFLLQLQHRLTAVCLALRHTLR